jgi:hypothetical protein
MGTNLSNLQDLNALAPGNRAEGRRTCLSPHAACLSTSWPL